MCGKVNYNKTIDNYSKYNEGLGLWGRNTARSLSRNLTRYNPQQNEWNCDSEKNRDGGNCEQPPYEWNIPQYNNDNNHNYQYNDDQFIDRTD